MLHRTPLWIVVLTTAAMLGCTGSSTDDAQGNSADGDNAPAVETEDDNSTTTASSSGSAASPTVPTYEDEPGKPLRFDLTEEEKARQAAEGGGGPDLTATGESIANSVPDSIKSGPVGSLGGAIFKGIIGAAGSSDDEDGETTDGDTPDAP